ncbi:MAG: trigger factor [Elusimicrobiota bacterium]|jgi:trigger factor|nr:trigger factor [Elusimicrobiota bacterium]
MSETKKIEFSAKVVEKKPISITMEVEVAADIVSIEFDKALIAIQKQVKVAGFRQGKAPMNLIKEKFSIDAKDRAVENVVKATVFEALEKEKFNPLDIPIVDELDYEIGKNLKYHFTAECHPQVEAKDYKKIPIKKEIYKVTNKSLKESIDAIRESNAFLVEAKSDKASDKSSVSVDYEAFDEKGVKIPKIEAKNFLLDLSAAKTLKEFKDELIGAKTGDQKDVKISYPADYPNETLAGKTAIFKTKILAIKEKQIPELNDDFAKDMGSENLEDFKKKVQSVIEDEEKRRQDAEVESQITKYLLEKNVFEVPNSLTIGQEDKIKERMRSHLRRSGENDEHINKYIEEDKDKIKAEAQKSVRLSYILNAIHTAEKLEVTDADLQAEKDKMLSANPDRKDEVEKYYSEKQEDIRIYLKETKLFKFLKDNADIKEIIKDMPLKGK